MQKRPPVGQSPVPPPKRHRRLALHPEVILFKEGIGISLILIGILFCQQAYHHTKERRLRATEEIGAVAIGDMPYGIDQVGKVGGQMLTFSLQDGQIVDDQTGTSWNILGEAIDGELAGEQLERIVSGDHFWFSWAAFRPETVIYESKPG